MAHSQQLQWSRTIQTFSLHGVNKPRRKQHRSLPWSDKLVLECGVFSPDGQHNLSRRHSHRRPISGVLSLAPPPRIAPAALRRWGIQMHYSRLRVYGVEMQLTLMELATEGMAFPTFDYLPLKCRRRMTFSVIYGAISSNHVFSRCL